MALLKKFCTPEKLYQQFFNKTNRLGFFLLYGLLSSNMHVASTTLVPQIVKGEGIQASVRMRVKEKYRLNFGFNRALIWVSTINIDWKQLLRKHLFRKPLFSIKRAFRFFQNGKIYTLLLLSLIYFYGRDVLADLQYLNSLQRH